MTELHLILLITLIFTVFSHLVNDIKIKFFIRGIISLLSLVALGTVALGKGFIIPDFAIDIQSYFKLRITPYNYLCYSVIALISIYFFWKRVIPTQDKNIEEKEYKISFDLVLISTMLAALSSSFSIFIVALEFMALLIIPSLIKTITDVKKSEEENNDAITELGLYQLSLLATVPAIAAFSIYYSGHNNFNDLIQFSLASPVTILNNNLGIDLKLLVSGLIIFYFVLRMGFLFYLVFSAVKINKSSSLIIPVISSMMLIGYVGYVKPILTQFPMFHNPMFNLIFLALLIILCVDFNRGDAGHFYLKKTFQLLLLLVFTTLLPMANLGDSFFESTQVLLFTMFFVSLNYANGHHLSIVEEAKEKGWVGSAVIISFFLIILTLSPTPFAPIVFSLYENIQSFISHSFVVTILALIAYGVITLPVIYQLGTTKVLDKNKDRVLLNFSSIVFILIYMSLVFAIHWGLRS